jgi:hypothetical protein
LGDDAYVIAAEGKWKTLNIEIMGKVGGGRIRNSMQASPCCLLLNKIWISDRKARFKGHDLSRHNKLDMYDSHSRRIAPGEG